MKEFARKGPTTISIVPHAGEDHADVTPATTKRVYRGWLRAVAPQDSEAPDERDLGIRRVQPATISLSNAVKADPPTYHRTTLGTREVLGVNRATVREGDTHRTWPADVVLKFLAADVVRGRAR